MNVCKALLVLHAGSSTEILNPCIRHANRNIVMFLPLRPPLLIRRGRFSDEDATRMWSHCQRRWCRQWQQRHHQQKQYGWSLPLASEACPWSLPLWHLTLALTLPRIPTFHLTLMTSPSAQPVAPAPPVRPSRDEANGGDGRWWWWGGFEDASSSSSSL